MFCILKAIFAWVIMLVVGTNLIGLVVRGLLWTARNVDELCNEEPEIGPTDRVREVLARESRRMTVVNKILTSLDIVLAAGYLYALFYFWNVGLAAAGVILMASRLPSLMREIRTGRKVTRGDMPRGAAYVAVILVLWGTLLLIWYSLCKWTP